MQTSLICPPWKQSRRYLISLFFYFFFLFWKIIYCYIKFQLKCLVQIFKIHFFSSSGKMYELQFFKRVLPKSTYIILYNIDWFWFIMRDSKSVVCKISAGYSCVCIVMFNHCRSVVCGHISLIWIFYEHENWICSVLCKMYSQI